MPKLKLNKENIKGITSVETGKRVDYWDTDLSGFGLRVSKEKKVFFAMGRVNGRKCRITIGPFGVKTADEARKQARSILGKISDGINPNEAKKEKRQRGKTLRVAYEEYVERKTAKGKMTENTKRVDKSLLKHVDNWMDKPLRSITGEMVQRRHQDIGEKSPTTANNVMRLFRRIYNHAADQDGANLPENPVRKLSSGDDWYLSERRKTIIKDHELPRWYAAVWELSNPAIRDYLLLLLFTGLRKNEGMRLKWEHVDLHDKTITLPGSMTKNKKEHCLPMSDEVEATFRRREDLRENEYVFPGLKTGHMVEPKRAVKAVIEQTSVTFCLHDLRRVFSTVAEGVVSYGVLKKLLNHSANGRDVTAGYLSFATEDLRLPMQAVTDAIMKRTIAPKAEAAVSAKGAKVIQLRRRAK